MINVVCAVIVNANGEVLICQRPEGKAQAGKWEFPGGKLEDGESERGALHREILEELGCEVQVGEALSIVCHEDEEFSIHLAPYLCEILRGEPQLLEHTAMRWCLLSDVADIDWAPADIPIWKELVTRNGLHSVS